MGDLVQDVRYGFRMLRKAPAFTAVAVITLALGIGLNLTVFAFVRPLVQLWSPALKHAERLVRFGTGSLSQPERGPASWADFQDWKQQSKTFEDIAGYLPARLTLTNGAEPVRIQAQRVTGNYFRVLGADPELGRTFAAGEDSPSAAAAAVISHKLWQQAFHSDPTLLGRRIRLDGESYTIIGVMPGEFYFPSTGVDVWTPLLPQLHTNPSRAARTLLVVGRIRSDTTLKQAQSQMDLVSQRLDAQYPATNRGWKVRLFSLRDDQIYRAEMVTLSFFGPVICVLLIACSNVANMLLARSSARSGEIAVRAALGAGRARLVRQLLTESLALAMVGGAAGLLVTFWALPLLRALLPPGAERISQQVAFNSQLIIVGFLLTCVTAVIFGLAPALRGSRLDLNQTLKFRGAGASPRKARPRNVLVIFEIAAAFVFLVLTGVFIHMFRTMEQAALNPGFKTTNLLTFDISLPQAKYADPQQAMKFYREVLGSVAAVPGVQEVAATSDPSLRGGTARPVAVETSAAPSILSAAQVVVTPRYFDVLGLQVRRGRAISPEDTAGSLPVALVNESMARACWPGQDPIGRRLKPGTSGSAAVPWITVVGVTADLTPLPASPPPLVFYQPLAQNPGRALTMVARTSMSPAAMIPAVKKAAWSLDQELALDNASSFDEKVDWDLREFPFVIVLFGIFGVLAMMLSAAGIFGVVSYAMAQRTREIGIRIAIGATPAAILRMLIREGAIVVGGGLLIGLVAALVITRLMASSFSSYLVMLPVNYMGVVPLALVAFLAMYIPTRRATKVDPMVALRYE